MVKQMFDEVEDNDEDNEFDDDEQEW